MGGMGPVPCEVFLLGGTCACVLVGGARSRLSEEQFLGPVECFGGVHGFSMALGTLSASMQDCASVWLKDRYGVFGTTAFWLLGVA